MALNELEAADIWAKAPCEKHVRILERTGAHPHGRSRVHRRERRAHAVANTGSMSSNSASASPSWDLDRRTKRRRGTRLERQSRLWVAVAARKWTEANFTRARPDLFTEARDLITSSGAARIVERFAALTRPTFKCTPEQKKRA